MENSILESSLGLITEIELDENISLYLEEISEGLNTLQDKELNLFIYETIYNENLSLEEKIEIIEEAFIKSMRKAYNSGGDGKLSYKRVSGKNRDKSNKNYKDLKAHKYKTTGDKIGKGIGTVARKITDMPKNIGLQFKTTADMIKAQKAQAKGDVKGTATHARNANKSAASFVKRTGKYTTAMRDELRQSNTGIKGAIGGEKGSGKANKARSTINKAAVNKIKGARGKLAKLRATFNHKNTNPNEAASARKMYDKLKASLSGKKLATA
jgi:hypothetical protein